MVSYHLLAKIIDPGLEGYLPTFSQYGGSDRDCYMAATGEQYAHTNA